MCLLPMLYSFEDTDKVVGQWIKHEKSRDE